MNHPLRGTVAIVGIGATPNYKHGTSPDSEEKLLLRAIQAACDDAGFDPRDIDGFSTYYVDRLDGTSLMRSLGTRDLKWTTMLAGGGGGAIPGAINVAAAAIISGQAEAVIIYRAITERDSGRFNVNVEDGHINSHYTSAGVSVASQVCGLRTQRMFETLGVPRSAMDAISLVDYHHARNNPRAMAYQNSVDVSAVETSRWIVEPYRLLHCSRETDAAAALLVVSSERARDLRRPPVYLMGATVGALEGSGENWDNYADEEYALAGFATTARRLWSQTGFSPSDIDVAQIYDNFAGLAVASLIQHGFCSAEEAGEFCTLENLIAPAGRLPINTDGGCLGEGFIHGFGITLEAVRQLRGESSNPVPQAKLCLVAGGPAATLTSSAIFGSAEAL